MASYQVKTDLIFARKGIVRGALHHLYIATTATRDALLQESVREISCKRVADDMFKVDVLFWGDVVQDLAKDQNVLFQHYPQFRNGSDPAREHDEKLFKELTTLLNSDGVIGFLDRNNMAGFSFPESALDPLREFFLCGISQSVSSSRLNLKL